MAQEEVTYSNSTTVVPVRPCIKWAGGKSKIANLIINAITSLYPHAMPINRYYEPFFGGGAVFWDLSQRNRFASAVISDSCVDLMLTYRVIRTRLPALVESLQNHSRENSKSYFDAIRNVTPLNDLDTASRFIYLNKTCFNGLYRVNAAGQFNVPWGKYLNPKICDVGALTACSVHLNRRPITIKRCDFEECVADADSGSVVYMDPPYIPASKTSSFTSYGAGGFGVNEHVRLARVARELVGRGALVVLSNAALPIVRDLYHGFEIHEIGVPRAINSDGAKRGNVGEFVIIGQGKST